MQPVRWAQVGEVRLAYQELGDRTHPTVLLVMGQGTQMLAWPDDVCTALAARGLHVVRFDNRDTGGSTHLPGRRLLAYSLDDLAADTLGLLDALGVPAAHLVGTSMGAMVTQVVATTWPQRVLSLTCIASSTGSRRVGRPRASLLLRLPLRRRAHDRVEAGELFARVVQAIGSPAYPVDPDRLRDLGARCYDRGHHPRGSLRQLLAVVRAPDRTAALGGVRVPTLVLHGDADPLVRVSGGRAVAAAVPGARLVTVPGLGHDLPPALWPLLVDEIHRVVERGELRRTRD
ncbi:MAG: alpha/beta hydrolase [Actinomycetota bacterium]